MALRSYRVASPRIAVVSLLAIQAVLLVVTSRATFSTADEPGHFAAGIAAWNRGAFDLYRVNPPLYRMLAAVPVLAVGVEEDYTRWHPEHPGARSEREVGQDFAMANGERYLDLIRIARLFTIAVTLLGGWIVFAWSRELFGERAGVFALAVWCFEPTVLAHGSLITPDMPCAVAGLGAMWMLARLLGEPTWLRAVAASVVLGVALLVKLTNLYLLLLWPAFVIASRIRKGPRVGAGRLAAIAGISVVVLNLGYGCQGTLRPLGSLAFTSHELAGDTLSRAPGSSFDPTGNRFRDSWLGALPVPLPADYLQGLDVQRHDFQRHFQSYLNGEWRDGGWWYYYLAALGFKVPLGMLVLVIVGGVLVVRSHKRNLATWCAIVPALVVGVLVSSQTGINGHLRYALPMFPFFAMWAGRVAECRDRRVLVGAAVLLVWSAISVLRVMPYPLAYFNELAGGPAHGDEHLLDSNLDWGQDALALREWVADNAPDDEIGLAYFGGADPKVLGLSYHLPPRDMPNLRFARPEQLRSIGPHPGLFAISVNFLRGLTFEAPDGMGRWQAIDPGAFTYFQRFHPIASAGYSIRIFCISLDEANTARARLALPPSTLDSDPVDCRRFRK